MLRASSPHPRDRGWRVAEKWQRNTSRSENWKILRLEGCEDSFFWLPVLLGIYIFFSEPALALGADFYVALNGSDTNAGTVNAPFATIEKCDNVMADGDRCVFKAGTYVNMGPYGDCRTDNTRSEFQGITGRRHGWLLDKPWGGGAVRTYTSFGDGEVILKTCDNNAYSVIDVRTSYLKFSDLTIWGRVFVNERGTDEGNQEFTRIKFLCPGGDDLGFDNFTNYSSIMFTNIQPDRRPGVSIHDNLVLVNQACIQDYQKYTSTPVGNGISGFVLYATDGAQVYNNDVQVNTTIPTTGSSLKGQMEIGIMVKRCNGQADVKWNYVSTQSGGKIRAAFAEYSNGTGELSGACGTTGGGFDKIHQNLATGVIENGVDLTTGTAHDGIGGNKQMVYNNTFVNFMSTSPDDSGCIYARGVTQVSKDNEIFNNICYNFPPSGPKHVDWQHANDGSGTAHGIRYQAYFDNNDYYPENAGSASCSVSRFRNVNTCYGSFASWKAAVQSGPCTGTCPKENSSRTIDPKFVSSTTGNFRLCKTGISGCTMDSPLLVGGRGTTEPSSGYSPTLGAYVTGNEKIGCTFHPLCHAYAGGGPADTTPPQAPQNVRIL